MGDAIVAVSTVKGELEQVERFLRRNLAGGVDHLVVFLDNAVPPVRRLLEAHSHVTAVRTGPKYWNGTRPARISDRLRINLNLANAVLTTVPSVGWLVSLDSDEVACIDRDALLRSPERAVLLSVREAVARRSWPDDEPTLFKSRPTEGELAALAALGVIQEPDLAHYFRGHQEGKPAIRPDLAVRLRVHSAVDEENRELVGPMPGMHVLHYESHSLDDFVRRWRDYSPDRAHLRTHRDSRKRLGIALHTLYHHDALDESGRARMIGDLFDRRVADDADTLAALGLVGPAPARDHRPRPLPDGVRDQVKRLVEALLPGDKHVFNEGGTADQRAAEIAAAADRMPAGDAAVRNIRAALERFHRRAEREHA